MKPFQTFALALAMLLAVTASAQPDGPITRLNLTAAQIARAGGVLTNGLLVVNPDDGIYSVQSTLPLNFSNSVGGTTIFVSGKPIPNFGYPTVMGVDSNRVWQRGDTFQLGSKQAYTNSGNGNTFIGEADSARMFTNNGSYWEFWSGTHVNLIMTNQYLISTTWRSVATGGTSNVITSAGLIVNQTYNSSPVDQVTNFISALATRVTNTAAYQGTLFIPFVFTGAAAGTPSVLVTIEQYGLGTKITTNKFVFSDRGVVGFSPVTNTSCCGKLSPNAVVTATDISPGTGASVLIDATGGTLQR